MADPSQTVRAPRTGLGRDSHVRNAVTFTIKISLPDDMRAFIEERVTQEGYSSASEYFHDLIRQAQRHKAKLDLEAKLAEGLQGPSTRLTRKDWQAMKREALDGLDGEHRTEES